MTFYLNYFLPGTYKILLFHVKLFKGLQMSKYCISMLAKHTVYEKTEFLMFQKLLVLNHHSGLISLVQLGKPLHHALKSSANSFF